MAARRPLVALAGAAAELPAGDTLPVGALPFLPVQQGGGANQGTNKVYLGWDAGNGYVRVQIDASDMGQVWCAAQAATAFSSGYIKFPNGLILQWASNVYNANADYTLSFPIAFANVCLGAIGCASYAASAGQALVVSVDGWTKSSTNVRARNVTSGAVAGATNLPVTVWAWGY